MAKVDEHGETGLTPANDPVKNNVILALTLIETHLEG